MGIIGFVYSTDTRTVDQPIYITCRTRKSRLGACAAERGDGDVCFLFTNFKATITLEDKQQYRERWSVTKYIYSTIALKYKFKMFVLYLSISI